MEDESVWGDGETSEVDGEDEDEYRTLSTHWIILIDARQNMFVADDNGNIPFGTAMEFARVVMSTSVVESVKNTVGVMFFGTREGNLREGEDADHVYQFEQRDVPSVSALKRVRDLGKDLETFKQKIGSMAEGGTCPLKEALWQCAQSLHKKPNNGTKRISVLTNDDEPFHGNPSAVSQALQVAKDIAGGTSDRKIEATEIWVWYSDPVGRTFDTSKFYAQLVTTREIDEDTEQYMFKIEGAETIIAKTIKKVFYKRRMATLPFVLGGDSDNGTELSMVVQIFKLIAPAKKPASVFVDRTGGDTPLQIVSKLLCATTGAYLDSSSLRRYFEFSGQKVYIDAEEVKEMKYPKDVGLKLRYFLPRAYIDSTPNMSAGYFVVPDEKSVKGSGTAFRALLESMSKHDMVAICRFVRNAAARPRLVAAIPQLESDIPAGLHLVIIPYSSDIRIVPSNEEQVPTDEQVSAAEQVLEALQFEDFQCEDFHNPALQKFHSVLRALALSEETHEWDETKDDTLQPDQEGHEAAQTAVEMLKIAIGADSVDPDSVDALMQQSKKRSGGAAKSAPKKKPKITDENLHAIKSLLAAGKLEKLKVPELKEHCRALGVPLSGKKQDLINRITSACV